MSHKRYRYNQHQYQIIQDHQALTHRFKGRGFNAMFVVVRCDPGSTVWVGGKAIPSSGGLGNLSASISLEDTKLHEEFILRRNATEFYISTLQIAYI